MLVVYFWSQHDCNPWIMKDIVHIIYVNESAHLYSIFAFIFLSLPRISDTTRPLYKRRFKCCIWLFTTFHIDITKVRFVHSTPQHKHTMLRNQYTRPIQPLPTSLDVQQQNIDVSSSIFIFLTCGAAAAVWLSYWHVNKSMETGWNDSEISPTDATKHCHEGRCTVWRHWWARVEVGSTIHPPYTHFTTTIGLFLGRIGLVVEPVAPECVDAKVDKNRCFQWIYMWNTLLKCSTYVLVPYKA